jgi:class 3 adenylate cyclase
VKEVNFEFVFSSLFAKNRSTFQSNDDKRAHLLSLVMPDHITSELVEHVRRRRRRRGGGDLVLEGNTLISRAHHNVALCFIDICDFSVISAALTPTDVVRFLGEFFTLLDRLSDNYPNITKIKTIGDAYFAAVGLTAKTMNDIDNVNADSDCVANVCSLVAFCVEAQSIVSQHQFQVRSLAQNDDERQRLRADDRALLFSADGSIKIRLRIGVHCGDVVAGIVGKKRPQYDIWGSACNMASRIEDSAVSGTIQVSAAVRALLRKHRVDGEYRFAKRHLSLKGIGRTLTYTLISKKYVISKIADCNNRCCRSEETLEQSLRSWHFRVFRLSADELIDAVMLMFEQLGVLTTFGVSESTIRTFVVTLRDLYQSMFVVCLYSDFCADNAYHNFIHAVDVTQAMFVMLTTMKQRKRLRPIDVFAIMVASLCHDCDHPGLTNAYLIATKSSLAEQCNHTSVLEQHHCEMAFELILSKKPNLLSSLSRSDRTQFKASVKSAILATDMAKHGVRVF